MLRLLLQAGLGFATFDVGRRIARMKRMAAFGAVAAVFALLGLGALTAALVILLEPRFGWAGAAGAVGAGLILLAALILWIGTWKRRVVQPTPIVDRVRAEVGAAGSALASVRSKRAARAAFAPDGAVDVEPGPAPRGARKRKALNMVLIATLAGVVLGRRL